MTQGEALDELLSALPTQMELEFRRRLTTGTETDRTAVRDRLLRFFDRMDDRTRSACTSTSPARGRYKPGLPRPVRARRISLALLRSDTRVRLSDHRGRPVGLIFGSYT